MTQAARAQTAKKQQHKNIHRATQPTKRTIIDNRQPPARTAAWSAVKALNSPPRRKDDVRRKTGPRVRNVVGAATTAEPEVEEGLRRQPGNQVYH